MDVIILVLLQITSTKIKILHHCDLILYGICFSGVQYATVKNMAVEPPKFTLHFLVKLENFESFETAIQNPLGFRFAYKKFSFHLPPFNSSTLKYKFI